MTASRPEGPTLVAIREALTRHAPVETPLDRHPRRAAVALVLAGDAAAPSLCLIRRAEHPDDYWSGHVALPGGRADLADPDARRVAERETLEEVGLRLGEASLIGALAEMPVRLAGVDIGLVLSPFVHYVGELTPLTPNYEVAEAFWVPLADLWDVERQTVVRVLREGKPAGYPGIRVGRHVVWGLTHRVLASFAYVIGRPLPEDPEVRDSVMEPDRARSMSSGRD